MCAMDGLLPEDVFVIVLQSAGSGPVVPVCTAVSCAQFAPVVTYRLSLAVGAVYHGAAFIGTRERVFIAVNRHDTGLALQ